MSSNNHELEIEAVGAPRKPAYNALRFIGADWLVLLVCIGGTFWLSSQITTIVGIVVMVPLGIFLLWPLYNARRYYAIAMAVYGRVWIDWVLEGVLWSAEPRQDVTRWRRVLMRLFVEPKVFMAQVDELYHYGVQYSSRLKTDSIAIEVDGWNFAGKPLNVQSILHMNLAEELKGLAYYKGLHARVSFVTRQRHQDVSDQHVQHFTHDLPKVFAPHEYEDSALNIMKQRGLEVSDATAAELYEAGVLNVDQVDDFRGFLLQSQDVSEAIKAYDLKYTTVFILTIPQSARLKRARRRSDKKRQPIKRAELAKQEIVRIAERFRNTLDAIGMDNPHVLNKREFEDFRREGRDVDPESITAYREWRLDHPDEDHSQAEESITTNGWAICFDGNSWHAVLRLTQLPEMFMPNTNMHLMEYLPPSIGSYVTRSVVSEIVRDTREYAKTTALYNLLSSVGAWIGIDRFGPKATEKEESLRNTQEKINRDKNINWFNIYLGLAHTDPAVIESDIEEVERAVQAMSGSCELVTGSAWTLKAADSANYGIAAM